MSTKKKQTKQDKEEKKEEKKEDKKDIVKLISPNDSQMLNEIRSPQSLASQNQEKPTEEPQKRNSMEMNESQQSVNESQQKDPAPISQQQTLEDVETLNKKKKILRDSGVLEAYEYFLRKICKEGFPSGNIYEYAAQEVNNYQRKKHAKMLEKEAQKKQEINQSQRLKFQNDLHESQKQIEPNPSPQKIEVKEEPIHEKQISDLKSPQSLQNKGKDPKKQSDQKKVGEHSQKPSDTKSKDSLLQLDQKELVNEQQPPQKETKKERKKK